MIYALGAIVPLLISLTAGCGITIHTEVTYRSLELFEPLTKVQSSYKSILERSDGFVQAGSFFPDWGYQCLGYNQQAEDAHWAPFIRTAIDYVKEKYPNARSGGDPHAEGLVAFVFAIMSHDVADVRWHSLQGLKGYFMEAMAQMDFHGEFSQAHTAADTGAEFTLQHSTRLNYINATWHVPVRDIVNIYARLYQNQSIRVPSQDHLIYCMTTAFAASRIDIEFGRFMFGYYGAKSPFLVKELVDYYKGGLQDMSASVAECHDDIINAFEGGPHQLLCGSYFDDGKGMSHLRDDAGTAPPDLAISDRVQKIFDDQRGVLTLSYTPKVSLLLNEVEEMPVASVLRPDVPPQTINYQYPSGNLFKTDWFKKRTCTDLQGSDEASENVPSVTLSLPEPSAAIGHATATGDLDKDGELELAISAPYHGESTQNLMSGAVFVLNGTRALLSRQSTVIDDIRDASQVVLMGTDPRGRFGWSIATLDLNGDGIDDLAVSAPFAHDNQGYIDVFYGRQDQGIASKPDLRIQVPGTEGFGFVIAGLDINADGHRDLVAGCPYCAVAGKDQAGAVYIFLSNRAHTGVPDITIQSAIPAPYEHFGSALEYSSTLGGRLLVGAPGHSVSRVQGVGRVYAFRVQPAVTLAWTMTGSSEFQHFGSVILLDKYKRLLVISSPSEETRKGVERRWQAGVVRVYDWIQLQNESYNVDLKRGLLRQMDGQEAAGHLGTSLAFFDQGLWIGEPMANGGKNKR
ncbi:hypothetical protein BJV82DRAFT_628349 [Fennellomyces sp. T-0311]|nr:hypothetical protein BJV82DRAFT_628349 [Fennellomyces sp. T-0311]